MRAAAHTFREIFCTMNRINTISRMQCDSRRANVYSGIPPTQAALAGFLKSAGYRATATAGHAIAGSSKTASTKKFFWNMAMYCELSMNCVLISI